jgi:hypothetical protein
MLLVCGRAFGSGAPVDQLVITENSSTSLSAKLDGVAQTVTTLVGRDNFWEIELTGVGGTASWLEPGIAGGVNLVIGRGALITVESDIVLGGLVLGNGVTDTTDFTIGGAQLNVTFTDNGDVPDAAATLSLLSLSLAGLGILRKLSPGNLTALIS